MRSIITEFLQRLYQHQITFPEVGCPSIEHLKDENVNTIFEGSEVQEKLVENMYLVQAYSDALQTSDLMEKDLSQARYN